MTVKVPVVAPDRPAPGSDPLVLERALGACVWDDLGRRHLDLTGRLTELAVGHRHPALARVDDNAFGAADLVATHTPAGLDRVEFTRDGAAAVDRAVEIARRVTGRRTVLSCLGATPGSSTERFWRPDPYRSAFHTAGVQQEGEEALRHLAFRIRRLGASTIAAIVLDTVTADDVAPPAGYLEGVRALCDREGILWIADETGIGLGSTGEWFATDLSTVSPDLLAFGRGLRAGHEPIGGVALRRGLVAGSWLPGPADGRRLSLAAAVVRLMEDEKAAHHAARLGADVIGPRLRGLLSRHQNLGDVRGLGVRWTLELVPDHRTGDDRPGRIVAQLRSVGVLVHRSGNLLQVAPPCTIPDGFLHDGLDKIDDALSLTDR